MALTYRPEIDGLRALAVLPVILFHGGFNLFSGGFVGVDVFFVISGYLIGFIILDKVQNGQFSLRAFYENRARRILPALFIVMLCSFVMAWLWMDPVQWQEFSQSAIWTSLFGSNFFFWSQEGYFAEPSELKPLLHTWSLAIEEQFYLVFPLVVLLFSKLGRKALGSILALLGLLSFGLCLWLIYKNPDAAFYMSPTRFWELLTGVACAWILLNHNHLMKRFSPVIIGGLSLLGLVLIMTSMILFDRNTAFPSAYTLIPVMGSALIILFASSDDFTGKLLSLRPLVWVGLISYSAYLWHQPLFAFARIRSFDAPTPLLMGVLASFSLVLAAMTWRWVEQPFRKRKLHQTNPAKLPILPRQSHVFMVAVLGIACFVLTGLAQNQKLIKPDRHNLYVNTALKLRQARLSRIEGIRVNTCHIKKPWEWEEHWDCQPGKNLDSSLKPVGIAIIGDSHASDKAMMLRTIGLSPLAFGAAGCPLNPKRIINEPMTSPKRLRMAKACLKLAEFAKRKISQYAVSEIWLANRFFEPEQMDLDSFEEILEFWNLPDKQIVFFSAMPFHTDLKRKLRAIPLDEPMPDYIPDMALYEMSRRPALLELLNKYEARFIDMVDIICDGPDDCDYKDNFGELLLSDRYHLSWHGAKQAGQMIRCLDLSPAVSNALPDKRLC